MPPLTGGNGTQADDRMISSGAAYIFTRTGSTWSQQAYIKASNTDINDGFGKSIALSGGTLAVGAFQENGGAAGINGNQNDNTKEDSGAVYIFTGSGSTWNQQAYIKASTPDKRDPSFRLIGDGFGWSVALLGDTLAVGAWGENGGTAGVNGNQNDKSKRDSGAVYLFIRSGSAWSQKAYIKASNPDEYDRFGASATLVGNILAVGANGESSNATGVNGNQADNSMQSAGAMYVRRIAP